MFEALDRVSGVADRVSEDADPIGDVERVSGVVGQAFGGLNRPAIHRVRWRNGFFVFFFSASFLNYDQVLDRSYGFMRSRVARPD